MQSLKCDICAKQLSGEAFELTMQRGKAVPLSDGGTLIANREAASLLQLCSSCGGWIKLGLRTLRESFEMVERLNDDTRWLRTG